MADVNDKILKELENISFMLGDLNAIRNGEYDPPSGSGSSGSPEGSVPTSRDLVRVLRAIHSELQEQTTLLRELLDDAEDE